MNEKLKRLVQISILEKQLDTEKKALSAEVIDDFGDESINIDWYTVSRVVKRTPKLMEWVTVDQIKIEFPTAVEFKADIKELEKIPAAHKYLALTESEYLMIKKDK